MEKIIHQIWVGPYEMPYLEKENIRVLKELNPDYTHVLWTDKNLPNLHTKVKEICEKYTNRKIFAFVADVLRVVLVNQYGGIYADVDWKPHKGFSDLELENNTGLIVLHDNYTSGNEFFACQKETGFIKYIYDELLKDRTGDHTPWWFNHHLKQYFDIEDNMNYHTEECIQIGEQFLSKMKDDGVKYLWRHGEFEKVYLEHIGLHSWCEPNMKNFAEGKINYR